MVMTKTDNPAFFKAENAFTAALNAADCYVQRGSFQVLDCLKMASEGKLASCFGNNAGSYYMTVFLPPAPGQDPAPAVEARGWPAETSSRFWEPGADNYPANPYFSPVGWSFKLRADEAVVLMGELPPECKYFSLINYILLTQVKKDRNYSSQKSFFEVKSVGGTYHPIFGSLGAPKNQFNTASSLTPNGTQGSENPGAPVPWGGRFVYAMCADAASKETVNAALKAAGIEESIINNTSLPAATLNMGLEAGKDTFAILGRVSQPTDTAAMQAWTESLSASMGVFRITPREEPGKHNPLPMGIIPARGNGIHEADIVPGARAGLDAIRSALIDAYGNEYDYEEPDVRIAVSEGMTGYLTDTNTLGDNHDAAYLMTGDFTLNTDEDFVAVYGVNHTATGKGVYSNAILYARPMLNGVCSVYDGEFKGSAAKWLKGSKADANMFYVCIMARETSALYHAKHEKVSETMPACNTEDVIVKIPFSTGNSQGKFFGADNGTPLLAAFRSYVERETGAGASYYEICWDRAIVFHKKG